MILESVPPMEYRHEDSHRASSSQSMDAGPAKPAAGPEHLILAYNVPDTYTSRMLEELITKTLPVAKKIQVLSYFPWENRKYFPRKIVCADSGTYDTILAKQDIWVKSEIITQPSQAITFVPGDPLDIPQIPFKSDNALLIQEHNRKQRPAPATSAPPRRGNSRTDD